MTINRNFLLVAILIAAVILHGSLYPYAFEVPASPIGPVRTLLQSWSKPPSGFGDLAANILLYVPFGFFAVLAINGRSRVLWVTAAGLTLCIVVELAQYYDAGRVTNMSDVYLNTFGTWLGAMGGAVAVSRPALVGVLSVKPIPTLLVIAFLGYRLFPYVPTIDLHKYWNALKPLFLHPGASPAAVFHYFALWLVASFLMDQVAGGRKSLVFVAFLMAFVFAAKVLIVSLAVTLPEVVGATLAYAFWITISGCPRIAAPVVAVILCAAITMLRLEPFNFRATPGIFSWLPFRGFLGGSLEINIASFFEKFFLYGSLVWIAVQAGLSFRVATLLVTALLFSTSLAEVYLPGRSAEITDALIALMTGVIFATLARSTREANGVIHPRTAR